MGFFADILGTLRSSFKIGRATLSSSGHAAARTHTFPNKTGTLAHTSDAVRTFGAQFYNNGSTLVPADANTVEGRFPISGSITRATVKTKGGTVSASFDLRVANYSSSSNPSSGDSIVGSNPPAVSSGVNAEMTSFTGWSTTTVTAGQAWSVALASVAGAITYASVIFEITPA